MPSRWDGGQIILRRYDELDEHGEPVEERISMIGGRYAIGMDVWIWLEVDIESITEGISHDETDS